MCGSPPDAPQLPQYPDLSPAQQQIVSGQGMSLQQLQQLISGTQGQLQQNQGILQQVSGLYNSDGTVNQSAVSKLQQQTQASNNQASGAGTSALSYLNSIYGTGGALGQTTQAYQDALAGKMPANQQLQYQQNQSYQQMQEEAAQRGIDISGTNFSNAVSNSTAGQKLIQNFQQNASMQTQNYQLGYLGQLGTNIGQLSSAGGNTATTGTNLSQFSQTNPLGYVGQSISGGQSALAPFLSQYQNNAGQAYQPLYAQQVGGYQQQMAQAQANYQAGMNQYNAGQSQMMGWANLGMQGLGAGASMYNANQNKQGMMALAAA